MPLTFRVRQLLSILFKIHSGADERERRSHSSAGLALLPLTSIC